MVRRSRKSPKKKISVDDLFDSVFGNGDSYKQSLGFRGDPISEEKDNAIESNVDEEVEVELPEDIPLQKKIEEDRLKTKLESFLLSISPIADANDSDILDDDTIHRDVFHRQKALDTLEKYRKDETGITHSQKENRTVITSSKSTSVKSCQNCYFSTSSRKLGQKWWSTCTNAAKSIEGRPNAFLWVESRLNLSCWIDKEQTEVAL